MLGFSGSRMLTLSLEEGSMGSGEGIGDGEWQGRLRERSHSGMAETLSEELYRTGSFGWIDC